MTNRRDFEFIAGNPALCLVDTVGQRGGQGIEYLNSPEDLARWLRAAGLAAAGAHDVSERELRAAHDLREAIYRGGLAVLKNRPIASADIEVLNRTAAKAPLRPQLARHELIQIAPVPVEAALSTLAADALHILGTPLRERIRECPDCRMMFLDNSRPGQRRWCSSVSGCGNRAKVRSLRARRSQTSLKKASNK